MQLVLLSWLLSALTNLETKVTNDDNTVVVMACFLFLRVFSVLCNSFPYLIPSSSLCLGLSAQGPLLSPRSCNGMLSLVETWLGQKDKIFPVITHGRRVSLMWHHVEIVQIVAAGVFSPILEWQLGNCMVLIWYQGKVHCRGAVNSKFILVIQVDTPAHSHFYH